MCVHVDGLVIRFSIMSAMSVPLWSVVLECQRLEWAFMSAVMMVSCVFVRYFNVLVMLLSSLAWIGLL